MAKISTKDYLKSKEYSIGLDIGTNSVGWAVADERMNLIKRCKKHLWGSRLFDERETAETRRKFRTARRRLLRRRVRLAMLDKIFADFVGDENFFARMRESFLQIGDRSQRNKNILFDENCTCEIKKSSGEIISISSDADYYKEFPTIYHLRQSIITHADWEFDPKLIYLAVHHILKSRGNFINADMDMQNSDDSGIHEMFEQTLQNACALLDLSFEEGDDFGDNAWLKIIYDRADEFLAILQDKSLNNKEKQARIDETFNCKKENKQISEMCKLMLGYDTDLKKIFADKFDESTKIKLSDAGADEKIASFGECAEFLESAKNLYAQIEFARLMNGKKYLSDLMIECYNRYKQQLSDLKAVFLASFPRQNGKMHPEYRKFFRDLKELNNYARYTYSANSCEQKEFYKNIEKVIKTHENEIRLAGENVVRKAKQILICIKSGLVEEGKETIFADVILSDFDRLKETELGFLQRPRVAGNGIFPKQAHESELNEILHNQGQIWGNFLNDDVQEKIKALFNFKIDYFVGPLGIRKNDKENFGWVERKAGFENTQITPFNYNDAVDFEKTRKQFIERMTGTCSYLIGEKALPKNSMYYCYFNVLNEINNLSVILNDNQTKLAEFSRKSGMNFCEDIINRLLETNTYKQKDLIALLSPYYENFMIKGFADGDKFNSNLKPIRDMARIVLGVPLTANTIMDFLRSEKATLCEEIIRDITIFGESKSSLKQSLNKYVATGQLNEKQIKELCTLKYTGWGNLSKKLIFGIKSQDENRLTILELMERDEKNFISVFSNEKYGFKQQVDEYLSECQKTVPEMVDELACSPSVKRGITQAFKVVAELVRVMGHAPQNVFLEFARGEDAKQKGKITKSRQTQVKKKYEEAKKQSASLYAQLIQGNSELKANLTDLTDSAKKKDFDNEKVMLYFLQAGKCMYTNEPLYLDRLSEYEVDHIVPRSLTTDNSFDNKVLVKKYANQGKQDSETVPSQFKQFALWKSLKTLGLLTNEKYLRLARTSLSDKDKGGFIKRQIVETRQIIKNTAIILDNFFKKNNMDTKVFSVKAELNSGFRKQFGYPKGEGGRAINDLHHAKDAYITTLMGNYLLNQDVLDNIESLHLSGKFYSANATKGAQNGLVLWSLKTEAEQGKLWSYDTTLLTSTVLQNFDRNYYSADCYVSKKIDSKPTGAFYDQTIYKNDKNVEKFGNLNKAGKPLSNSGTASISIGKLKRSITCNNNNTQSAQYLEPNKYGGYSSNKYAYFMLIEYMNYGKKLTREIVGYPYYILVNANNDTNKADLIKAYLERKNNPKNTEKYCNFKILNDCLPKNIIIQENKYRLIYLTGETRVVSVNRFKILRKDKELYQFIYMIYKSIGFINLNNKQIKYIDYLSWDKLQPQILKEYGSIEEYIDNQFEKFYNLYIDYFNIKYTKNTTIHNIEISYKALCNFDSKRNFCDIPNIKELQTHKMFLLIELLKIVSGYAGNLSAYGCSPNSGTIDISPTLDWDNTYIIHNSVTGIYSKKEKIIKNK